MPAIVFVNRFFHPDESATSQLLTALVAGLTARQYVVRVVCSRQRYDDAQAELPAREQIQGASVHRIATTRFGRHRLIGRTIDYASFYVACAFTLIRLLRRGDVLVLKTDPPLLSLIGVPLASLTGARLVNWQQDVFPEVASRLDANPLPRWLDRAVRRMRDASLRSSRMTVVIGTRMRDHFAARGIPPSRLRVIENWADPEAIKPKPSDASALRSALGLRDRFVACYSGNLGRAHEFETLLAAAQLLKRDRRFVFLMIGDGAKMAALKRRVVEQALENFCFLPFQAREDLDDVLAAGDVHVASLLPTLEGLIVPSKMYGVFAAGRPLIFVGDADGEVARVIDNAHCGVTVPVNDGQGLADQLRYLQEESAVRLDMGVRARDLVCRRYSTARAIDRWVAMLSSI